MRKEFSIRATQAMGTAQLGQRLGQRDRLLPVMARLEQFQGRLAFEELGAMEEIELLGDAFVLRGQGFVAHVGGLLRPAPYHGETDASDTEVRFNKRRTCSGVTFRWGAIRPAK